MIRVEHVGKRFGTQAALENVSLEVPEGQVCGLLGHNGAGKSTLIGILLGQVFPDRGTVRLDGHDVFRSRRKALRRVGAIFETPAFYGYLSGETNLRILSSYTAAPEPGRLRDVVKLVGLEGVIRRPVATYSHGMRQRLALAQALLPDPRLLILDEPADGLDPEGLMEMRDMLRRLNREWGLTLLLSSHLLHEVQQTCDHVAVLRRGRLVYTGSWREIVAAEIGVRIRVDRQAEAEAELCRAGLLLAVEPGGWKPAAGVEAPDLVRELVHRGFAVREVEARQPSLEDVYRHWMGGGA